MNRTSFTLVVSALAAACCGVAHAATESWLVPLSASLNSLSGDSSFTYPMPLFNEQGGTRVLTGVQITGSAMFATSTQVFNGDLTPYAITVTYAAGFTATLPSGSISAFDSETLAQPFLIPATFEAFSFNLDSGVTANVGNFAAFSALNGGTSMQSGTFTGGLILPPIPGLLWSTPQQLMGGSLSVTYTYTVIPAPAAAAVLAASGLAALRRRRG